MPFYNLSVVSKKIIIVRLICFFWIIAKIISWKVWLADRLFPIVPPFDFLSVPSFIHTILFSLSLAGLIILFLFPSKKILSVSVVIIEILSCALDQNRWQPWEYQYIFLLLAFIINYKNEKNAISIIAFALMTLYFFSGLSKLNPAFNKYLQHQLRLFEFFRNGNSYLSNFLMYHLGYVAGTIETLSGILLLFNSTKKIAAVFLISMHCLILLAIGPLGINYNVVVWPWNIAMITLLCYLFISKAALRLTLQPITKGWNKLFIIFLGILPVLNFFGYWDFYLSSSLYSYKQPDMYICIHKERDNNILKTFESINMNKKNCDSNSTLIDVKLWSLKELQVPVYPELRIYKNIQQQLVKKYPDMNASFLINSYVNGKRIIIELK